MFNKIFNTKQDKQDKQENSNGLAVLLQNDEQQPYVYMFVDNLSDQDAIKFANMLFSLSNGLYAETLYQNLQNLAKEGAETASFVNKVITQLLLINEYASKEQKTVTNEPVVKPTNFMKKNNE